MTEIAGLARFIHLLSFASFFGSVLTVWILKNIYDRDASAQQTFKGLCRLALIDKLVTGPSAVIVLISGLVLASSREAGFQVLWVQALLGLWLLGAIFARAVAIPQLNNLATLAKNNIWLDEAYWRLSRKWNWSNSFLVVILIISTGLAVFRPA